MVENNLSNNEMQQRGAWYKLRFLFVMFCVLVATVLPAGCERNTPTGENNKPNIEVTDTTTVSDSTAIKKYHVELEFDADNLSNIHMDTVQKYLDDEYVDSVYLVLNKGSTFTSYTNPNHITNVRNYMQQRTDLSSRVRGRGTFAFQRGVCLPADSLYFVSKGWKVKTN